MFSNQNSVCINCIPCSKRRLTYLIVPGTNILLSLCFHTLAVSASLQLNILLSFFFSVHVTYIVTNFFIIKPTRCTNFTHLFWHETLRVSDSSSVHHQEFIHCTLSNGICHTGLQTAFEQDQDGMQFHPGLARQRQMTYSDEVPFMYYDNTETVDPKSRKTESPVARANKFCTVASNISGSSVRDFLCHPSGA